MLHSQLFFEIFQLVPSTTNLNTQDGYFFHYKLFGNDITSETFQDLMQPEFHPERASVRIRTSIQLLRTYFETFHPIEFTLWSGNDIVGQTQIPIHKIVKPLQQKAGLDKLFDVLPEEFQLRLSPSTGNEKKQITDDEISQPMVKVEVKLSREIPVNEQKTTHEKQHRTRSNSMNNHTSNTTLVETENRFVK
jgi:hypothetical protein